MIVVGSCYFLLTLLIPYDQNIDLFFPLKSCQTFIIHIWIINLHIWHIQGGSTTDVVKCLFKSDQNLFIYLHLCNSSIAHDSVTTQFNRIQ